MINRKQTLQEMIQSRIVAEDFHIVPEDTHTMIKMIISVTLEEKLHDFIHLMFDKQRKEYTLNLFEAIETVPWYDFKHPEQDRFILIWQLPSVGDKEEVKDYFEEVLQSFNQDFGDIILDIVGKDNPDTTLRLITHENQIMASTIK